MITNKRVRHRTFLFCDGPFLCCSVFDAFHFFQIFVIGADPVHEAIGFEADDPVGDGLDELVVMGAEEHIALEIHQAVVDGGDAFQVQVVGGLIQHEHIGRACTAPSRRRRAPGRS